jgi:hypothetical protein
MKLVERSEIVDAFEALVDAKITFGKLTAHGSEVHPGVVANAANHVADARTRLFDALAAVDD